MSIKYVLAPNNLTADPDDFTAIVRSSGSLDEDAIIEAIIGMGSTVTRADIVSVLADLYTAIEKGLLAGKNVLLPIANFSLSIQGVFNGVGDVFDPTRHRVNVVIRPGQRLRRTIAKQAEPEKIDRVLSNPLPVTFTDLNSGTRNSTLTPGGMGQLEGHRLKFQADDPAQGIFFIHEDGTETRVEVVGLNKASLLMFMVPASLTSGEYILEVRVVSGKGVDALRSGRLPVKLTVA